jgi:ribosome-associated protein
MKVHVRVAPKTRRQLQINTEFIRLDSALKLSSAVSTGGEAKFVIQDGLVLVNGIVCLQRGKKLRNGDIFEFQKMQYEVVSCV